MISDYKTFADDLLAVSISENAGSSTLLKGRIKVDIDIEAVIQIILKEKILK